MSFGGHSMNEACFNFIREILPDGKTILELGSGWTTGELCKYYNVISIESNPQFLNHHHSNYIYAPIKLYSDTFMPPALPGMGSALQKGWFDPEAIKKNLLKDYDLILVDGPPGPIGRGGFYLYLHYFNTDVPIIFDDTHRPAEKALLKKVSKKLNREIVYIKNDPASAALL